MKQFLQGIKDGSPIGIGYFSVSFTFGLAAASSGLGWWEALLVSMMNMTSAGQFAGITVMAAAGSYLEMAVSQFVINLRYALMSISLSQKVESRFGAGKKLILGFANTDEIFAVAMSREGEVSSRYFAGLASLPYLGWTVGTLVGGSLREHTAETGQRRPWPCHIRNVYCYYCAGHEKEWKNSENGDTGSGFELLYLLYPSVWGDFPGFCHYYLRSGRLGSGSHMFSHGRGNRK